MNRNDFPRAPAGVLRVHQYLGLQPGPKLIVLGGVHGDETCGTVALGRLIEALDAGRLPLAVDIASIPEHIRGYGHVKEAHLHEAKAREASLLATWRNPKALHIVQAA